VQGGSIDQGDFVEVGGKIFVVIEDDSFVKEGGFTKCPMQRVAGLTDQQHTNPKVADVIRSEVCGLQSVARPDCKARL